MDDKTYEHGSYDFENGSYDFENCTPFPRKNFRIFCFPIKLDIQPKRHIIKLKMPLTAYMKTEISQKSETMWNFAKFMFLLWSLIIPVRNTEYYFSHMAAIAPIFIEFLESRMLTSKCSIVSICPHNTLL